MAKPAERSIKRRIIGTLLVFALLFGATFTLVAHLTFEAAVAHLIRWHMEPVMRVLVTAEEKARGPGGSGEGGGASTGAPEAVAPGKFGGASLADVLGVRFYTGENIPPALRAMRPGLHEIEGVEEETYALVSDSENNETHVLVGEIAAFEELEHIIVWILAGSTAACLIAAAVVGLVLSRGLVAPLLELSRRVRAGTLEPGAPLLRRKDEIGFLGRTFAEHERELREFLAREQLFTGDVSHELRTPLTVMHGAVELLESRMRGKGETWPEVERMRRTVASMTGVVHTLLLLSRKSGDLEMRTLDMVGIVRREAERARGELAGRPVSVSAEYEGMPDAWGNPELAAVIVGNLVENACRYTERGAVRLILSETEFSVSDTGATIPEDVRARMFERGARGHSDIPGSGLGLSIAQRSCERMGWTVEYRALHPSGNLFKVGFGREPV